MKYIIYSLLVFSTFCIGCTKKSDTIFDKTVDERLSETLANYQTALASAPGWKLFVYPKGLEASDIKIGGLTYYVKFTADNRVSMVSDFSRDIAATPKQSSYRLKALQRPSLIFDTYSYMHIAADPDPQVSLSPTGSGGYGYGTDFNFSFKEVTPKDTILLEGNFNKSAAVLVKATQAEMDAAFTKGRLRDMINFTRAYQKANPFLYFAASPGLNVGVGFDTTHFMLSTSTIESGNLVNKNSAFSYTTYGLHLGAPLTVGNYTFQDIYWDDAKNLFYITTGSARVEFANGATPVVSLNIANVLGGQYTTISIPPGAGLPNESPLFLTRYTTAKNGMLAGPYALRLDDLDFVFNTATKSMVINAYVYQGAAGFLAQYSYTYTITNGLFKFTKTSQNGNAALIVNNMNSILSYIESDQFEATGYSTSSALLGQLTSKQTPTFYFSGYLL